MRIKSTLICVLFSVWLLGCNSFISDKPVVSFYRGNVLLPNIHFETSEEAAVYIEYWPEQRPQKMQRSKIDKGTEHDIILKNVTPQTKYSCIIYQSDRKLKSEVVNFTTGEVPDAAFR